MDRSNLALFMIHLMEKKVQHEVKYMVEFEDLWNRFDDMERLRDKHYSDVCDCCLDIFYRISKRKLTTDAVQINDVFQKIKDWKEDVKVIEFYDELYIHIKRSETSLLKSKLVEFENLIHAVEQKETFIKNHEAIQYSYKDHSDKWNIKSDESIISDFPFKDIYMEQYAYLIYSYENIKRIIADDNYRERFPKLKLGDNIIEWYYNNSSLLKGDILFLLGEPGHGKSSFCTYMVNAYPKEKIIVININQIQNIQYIKNFLKNEERVSLKALLDKAFRKIDGQEYSELDYSYLKDCLIILDGYDEFISSTRDLSFKNELVLEKIVTGLNAVLEETKRNKNKIIVTSRRAYLTERDIDDLLLNTFSKECNILYLASLDIEEQKDWVIRYSNLMNTQNGFTLEALIDIKNNNKNLYELTKIPILFQLIVVNNFTKKTSNRVSLYEKLFTQTTFERSKKHEDIKTKKPEELHMQLENIALIIQKDENGDDTKDVVSDDIYQLQTNSKIINSEQQKSTRFFYCYYKNQHDGKTRVYYIHRSFYQHFLAYGVYRMLLNISLKRADEKICVRYVHNFLFFMKYIPEDVVARNELFQLIHEVYENEKSIVKNKQINEGIVNNIINEIIKSQCIHGVVTKDDFKTDLSDILVVDGCIELSPLRKMNNVFVNSVSLLSTLFDDEVSFSNPTKVEFGFLMRSFNCYGIAVKNCIKTILNKNDLCRSNLSNADLSKADLNGAKLIGAKLFSADLSDSDLNDVDLSRADLSNAKLIGAKLIGANLSGAKLSGADLISAKLIGAKMIGADLISANLSGADLYSADIRGAKLYNTKLYNTKLRSVDLRNTDLSGLNLINANLSNANLSGADLSDANLHGAGLSDAKLFNTKLIGANLRNAKLHSADLSDANLRGADLHSADLSNANLSNANLYNINLCNADLSSAYVINSCHKVEFKDMNFFYFTNLHVLYDESTKGLPYAAYDKIKHMKESAR